MTSTSVTAPLHELIETGPLSNGGTPRPQPPEPSKRVSPASRNLADGIPSTSLATAVAAKLLRVVHLTSSRFYGGPERQMLGLAAALVPDVDITFVSFAEGGLCESFLSKARESGFDAHALRHDTPWLRAAYAELRALLARVGADVLCVHGYKAGLLGLLAARRLGLPVVAVSRGWTAENRKVRAYEALDRRCLRHMDAVVCVSDAQAKKVIAAGVPAGRVRVIRNSIDASRFAITTEAPPIRETFPAPPRLLVGAAGRLSPEKGFDVLIDAAERILRDEPEVGFVIFGDGPLRESLSAQIAGRGLSERVLLAGFRGDLDAIFPQLDLFVLPSYTEGLPNVVLEASAAGVPVVATAVGGTPEVVDHGRGGYLVEPGNAAQLAARILDLARMGDLRRDFGKAGRARVMEEFTFAAQARAYRHLLSESVTAGAARRVSGEER